MMRLVIVESPYAGDVARNEAYARAAMRDCLERGEAPMVSHLLYTQVLDDDEPAEREQGIAAGLAWGACAWASVIYVDLGISAGMREGIERAKHEGRTIEYRCLGGASGKPVAVITWQRDEDRSAAVRRLMADGQILDACDAEIIAGAAKCDERRAQRIMDGRQAPNLWETRGILRLASTMAMQMQQQLEDAWPVLMQWTPETERLLDKDHD